MRTSKEKLITKIFNNPIGRWYFNVPQGKKIYKITRSSVHYYTGEIAKNGLPIICTGAVSPGGRNTFINWLETWKPIHLCWLFIKIGCKIPKYFIGADTGAVSPGTMADSNAVGTLTWANPDNAKTEGGGTSDLASGAINSVSHYLKATNFGFSIPSGTINGIKVEIKKYALQFDDTTKDNTVSLVKSDGTIGSTNKAITATYWPLVNQYFTYGGTSDLWGETPTPLDINDADWGVVLSTKYFSTGETAKVDHIRMTIYYTASAGPANLKSYNTNLKANIKTINTNAISNTKTLNTNA